MKKNPWFEMVALVWIVASSAWFIAHVTAALLTRFN